MILHRSSGSAGQTERWDLDAEELLRRVLDMEPENAQAVNKLGAQGENSSKSGAAV